MAQPCLAIFRQHLSPCFTEQQFRGRNREIFYFSGITNRASYFPAVVAGADNTRVNREARPIRLDGNLAKNSHGDDFHVMKRECDISSRTCICWTVVSPSGSAYSIEH